MPGVNTLDWHQSEWMIKMRSMKVALLLARGGQKQWTKTVDKYSGQKQQANSGQKQQAKTVDKNTRQKR